MKARIVVPESLYKILAESGEINMDEIVVNEPIPVPELPDFELPKRLDMQPYYRRFEKKRRRS